MHSVIRAELLLYLFYYRIRECYARFDTTSRIAWILRSKIHFANRSDGQLLFAALKAEGTCHSVLMVC